MSCDAFVLLPILLSLEPEGDEPDPNSVPNGHDIELKEIEGAIERQNATIGEVSDIAWQPHQLVFHAEFFCECLDVGIALKEVMVEDFDARIAHRNCCRLAAKLPAFPHSDIVSCLGES